MAYDALRTIMPIAGWPEEPFSTSFSRAAGSSSTNQYESLSRADWLFCFVTG